MSFSVCRSKPAKSDTTDSPFFYTGNDANLFLDSKTAPSAINAGRKINLNEQGWHLLEIL
jgi:hypothetical protein